MEARAVAKNISVSPRKLRLLAEAVKGRKVEEALGLLNQLPSPNARLLAKAVKSAAANAEGKFQAIGGELRIVRVTADKGIMLKRFRPRSRGRPSPRKRRFSHLTVVVG